ncbi:cell division septum initiation protein DivIVA [Actinopolyspora lacussalsi]|nr:cell division septum initiation protein DivIVA [Actinopolyspora lacussalsi]
MEDEAIVPLRPGFDNEFRGFNRKQVLEHIELLEDQIRILVTDRDEAIRLNEDQRRITDETRRQMEETAGELKRVQNADTGQPYITARMQHMLNMAEEEATAIREHANREAETIRGVAETDAERIRNEAENRAAELRQECSELVDDLEERRKRLDEEHASRAAQVEARAEQLKQSYRSTYEEALTAARRDADELLQNTRQRCGDLEEDARRRHSELMSELRSRAEQLEDLRSRLVQNMDAVATFVGQQRDVLSEQPRPLLIVEQPQREQAPSYATPGDEATGEAREALSPAEPEMPRESSVEERIPFQPDQQAAETGNRPIPVNPVTEDDPVHDEVPVLNRANPLGTDGENHPHSVDYGH